MSFPSNTVTRLDVAAALLKFAQTRVDVPDVIAILITPRQEESGLPANLREYCESTDFYDYFKTNWAEQGSYTEDEAAAFVRRIVKRAINPKENPSVVVTYNEEFFQALLRITQIKTLPFDLRQEPA